MKVHELIKKLDSMPSDAEVLLFTNFGKPDEELHPLKDIRLLEEDPDNVDLVELLY